MTARKSHHYLLEPAATVAPALSDDNFELDEAEVWSTDNGVVLAESEKHERKPPRVKKSMAVDRVPKSLPLNIPDWSKILGSEYRRHAAECLINDEEDEEEEERNDPTPPHEYLARTRGTSFSVGTRPKGRDLDRVRNAIWKQIGLI